MNNLMQIVENEKTSEFYPTPESLVRKMLEGVKWDYIKTILEPSAGKGDIIRAISENENSFHSRYFDVDCIEIDTNLRQVLKYNFSEERKSELKKEISRIKGKYKYCEERFGKGWVYYNDSTSAYEPVPYADRIRIREIEIELDFFLKDGIHIVHDDFLTYSPYKEYDLIVMNPPFSNGDKHLLKALKIQEKGGSIICLLNAETIRNPYTDTRRELVNLLNKHNATIEYINDAFVTAERKTGVEIALIKVSIEAVKEESDIYNRLKEAEKVDDFNPEATELDVTDYIKAAVHQFNVEVKAGLELIRQYRALVPYMATSFDNDPFSDRPILKLVDDSDNSYGGVSVNNYLKKVRYKYWKALLSNPKFVSKLTSELQKRYRNEVNKLANYDFTEYNIRTLSAEMNAQIKTGIEDEIIKMFDRLTEEHSYYPECSKNRHLYDGWKTNKAHKIDKKVILPCYGVFDSYDGKPRTYNVKGVLEDIERIFNFFDGGMSREVDFWGTIKSCFEQGITKNVELKYFTATFYKKGTVHLVFNCPELIERFNIYAAQYKKWLPPNYGKTKYKDMTAEEKAVVDSFQGEKAYTNVMDNAGYYLAPVTSNQMLMLEG